MIRPTYSNVSSYRSVDSVHPIQCLDLSLNISDWLLLRVARGTSENAHDVRAARLPPVYGVQNPPSGAEHRQLCYALGTAPVGHRIT